MTSREQICHLLRRFGFGPSVAELAIYEPLGVDGTIARLIDYDSVDEEFPISPWEICFEDKMPDMYVDAPRIGAWWALRMLLTKRPLQENLTLFWHNHFAVSAQKIEFGPIMAEYIQALRTNASGHFPALVEAASTTPAMLRWLDTDTSVKGHPNENFARELMELFTLGIGHYTEADVKDAARAFTGWGNRYLIYESGAENLQSRLKDAVKTNQPMIAFSLSPTLQDQGIKTVLSKTGPLDGFAVMNIVARHPETVKRICRKLWEWFAYADPEPAVVEKLAQVFTANDYLVRPVLRQIAAMPEFWSDKCVRQKVKSPVDFVVGTLRQFDLQPLLRSLRPGGNKPDAPLPKPLRDTAGLLWGTMYQQGLALLYPPDVSGWHWGKAWLSSANMAERMKFPGLIFGIDQPDKVLSGYLANKIKSEHKAVNPEGVVNAILRIFDCEFEPAKRAILVKAATEMGGVPALDKPETASKLLHSVCRLVFSSPEYQMC